MTVRSANFLRDPRVEFLSALLEQLREGALGVPRFQRPFVWDESRQLELLRSVREGIPIGSLMIWETNVQVSAASLLGERTVAPSQRSPHRYLLDGQQRMATLYGALVPVAETEVAPERQVWFDLELDDFVFLGSNELREVHLDPRVMLDTVKFRRATRRFPEQHEEAWIERAEEVAAAFSAYKLATLTIATDDVETAIRTFERVNTQGVRMSGVHMIHALTWSEGFHLGDSIEALRVQLLEPVGWGSLDDERVLDACRLELGLPLNDRGQDVLARELKRTPEALPRAVESVARAATFLHDVCCVRSPRLLPYRQQLLVIAEALKRTSALSATEQGRLISWFWASSLIGWFEGEGARARQRLEGSIRDIRDIVAGQCPRPFGSRKERTPLSPTFNLLSARGKALALLLVAAKPLRADGQEFDVETFLDREELSLAWMAPRAESNIWYASPGNRFVLSGMDVSALRGRIVNPRVSWASIERVAASHLISHTAWSFAHEGRWGDFVDARRKDLNTREQLWLESHLATLDPS